MHWCAIKKLGDCFIYCFALHQIKRKQNAMTNILYCQTIEYETIDIAVSTEFKDRMRVLMGDEKALPPQIFKGDKYLGVSII